MIRVTVELFPHGLSGAGEELGIGNIINDGTGNKLVGNYDCSFSRVTLGGLPPVSWNGSRIENFPRLEKHFWQLIHEALGECLYGG